MPFLGSGAKEVSASSQEGFRVSGLPEGSRQSRGSVQDCSSVLPLHGTPSSETGMRVLPPVVLNELFEGCGGTELS